MATFTNRAGDNDLSNPLNWDPIMPGANDLAVINSNGLVPTGQSLSVHGSLSVLEVDLVNLTELANVSIYASSEVSVAGFTNFQNGNLTINTGSNPGNFDVGGGNGSGEFVQGGGVVTVNTGLLVGYSTGGTYVLNGGTVSASYEVIAGTGSGAFQQNGGSNSVASELTLGRDGGPSVGNSGAYTLAAGSLTAGLETVGNASAGAISQSGGSNTVVGTLTLGNQQASSGAYFLSGGTLSVGGNEVVGFSGQGRFDQDRGDNAIQGGAVLGLNQGASGNYLLHDGGTLEANYLTVGFDGDGEFNIQNAMANISGPINIGRQTDGHGSLEVIGGRLNAQGSTGLLNVGFSGSGNLVVQGGGTISANLVNVGVTTASHGMVDIDGAGSTLWIANNIALGNGGSALVRIENGAHLRADRIVMATQSGNLASQTGSLAAVQISGVGTLVQAANSDPSLGAVVIGLTGGGAVAISDQAALKAGTAIVLGANGGAEGALMASSGADIESTALIVGRDGTGETTITGTGTIVHTAGTNLLYSRAGVVIGVNGVGALTVENGASLNSEAGIVLGANSGSSGSMTVDGGKVTTNVLKVGDLGTATLTLAAGEIDTIDEIVGGQASTITQSGGTQYISGSLYLSSAGGGYTLANGAALNVHNDLFINNGILFGDGSVSISDGLVVLAGGALEAHGGVLLINSSIESDAGSILIDSHSTLEFSGQRLGFHIDIHGIDGSQDTVFQLDQGSSVVADSGADRISTSAIVDNGWIEVATGGHLAMQGVVTGAGSMLIDPHATLELQDAALGGTGKILFETNYDLPIPTVLQIDNDRFLPSHLVNGLDIGNGANTILGFTLGDTIDLRFLLDGKATLLTGLHQNVLEVDGVGGPYFLQLDPLANYSGFDFVTSYDGFGGTNIRLQPNLPPVAVADFAGVQKNSAISLDARHGVLANDSDPDHDVLTVNAVNGDANNVGHAIVGKYGTLTLNGDGSFSFAANSQPGALPAGTVPQDIFNYTMSDGHGNASTSTLTMTLFRPGQDYAATTAIQEVLNGGSGKNVLVGATGNSTLSGGNGADWLIAGTGNTTMTGGNGPDTFVFAPGLGKDVITDFNTDQDRIQLHHDLFIDFLSVQNHMQQVGQGTVIAVDPSSTITLEHVAMSSLHATDFHFV